MPTEATIPAEGASTSLFSSLASFFIPTAHAEEASKDDEESGGDEEESGGGDKEESGGDAEEEEEEDEPEDIAPVIRDACQGSECQEPAKHFKHCSEKVEGGKGWHGEDCVEELFHLMHCVDACAAPKLFKKLA